MSDGKKSMILILFLPLLFFGVGLLNIHGFQNKAKRQSEYVLKKYFAEKGETIKKAFPPDYTLEMIEVKVVTDKDSYYAVLGVTDPWWIRHSILNYFVTPNVEIRNIDFYDTKRRKLPAGSALDRGRK